MKKILMALALMPFMALAGTIGEGLNCPELTWVTGGVPSRTGEGVDWSYTEADSHGDGACVTSGAGGAGDAISWLKAEVTGPCKISFWYKVQTYNGSFTVYCDSSVLYNYTGVTGTSPSWQFSEYEIPSGTHEIKLQYHHPGMGYAYEFNGARVDNFTVTSDSSLAEALDAPQLTFTTGGNANWFGQTSVSHDGVDAAQSGAIGDSQSTWMQTTFTGEKDVRFWWKVSSEGSYDHLRVYVDGTEQGAISGDADWTQKSFHVSGSGSHTLKWTYSKDGSVTRGSDCGWVDQLTILSTYYVNGATGSDTNPGTSPESAKKTIQAAIDISEDGDTILVAPGTYDKFTSSNTCIRVESSDGPFNTIINGSGVSTVTNIMRLNGGIDGGTNTFVVGFTIQHLTRIDGGTIRRCIVRDNDTSRVGGGALVGAVAENCLILNNRGMNGAVSDGSILRNCTMVGNSASSGYDGVCLNSVLENCIVYGNANNERQTWQYWFERSWLAHWDHREVKVFDRDPKFVDAANGDYHLSEDSDCIDFGDNRYAFMNLDLDGRMRIINGVVDIGCYEYGSPFEEGLVAWYKFDGNALDYSGNGYHASLPSSASYVAGRDEMSGNAAYFGGRAPLEIPSVIAVPEPFSYSVWFRTDATQAEHGSSGTAWNPGNDIVHSSFRDGYLGVGLRVGTDGAAIVEHGGCYRPSVLSVSRTLGTVWHHAVVSVNGGVETLYLDGENVGSVTPSRASQRAVILTSGEGFGGGYWGYYTGELDDARIYNRVLSADEVKALYDREKPARSDGLVAHYEFNGDARDSSGYGNDGVVHGATLTTDRFGNANGAYSFDGNSVIQAADSDSLSSITGQVSMSVWVRIDEWQYVRWGDNRAPLVFKQGGTGLRPCQYGWFVLNGDVLANCSAVDKGSRDDCFFDRDVPMGVWFHLALSEDSNGMSVYINGRCVGVSDESAEHRLMLSDLYIGNSADDTGGLIGAMDDIRIYNRALSAEEVKALYDREKPPMQTWTVSFDAQGGVASQETKSVTNNTAIGELPTAELFGYDLLGWYSDAEGGVQVTPETIITNDVTLYAHWEKADLGVDYVLGGHWETGTTASGGGMIFSGLDETAEGGLSVWLKSEDDCKTWIETTVTGEMWLSFDWKTSCETYEELELDRIEFSIDGHRQSWANGETDWTNLTFAVRGEGEHTIRFTYVKDESEAAGEDSVWVANVTTAPKTAVATPVIDLAETYATESTTCTITTETEGATIRYKFDYYGDESEWFEYTEPFEVTGSKTVIAYATKLDYYDSGTVRASCERTMPWTLAECVNAPHLDFVTGGDEDWVRTTTTTHDGVAAIRSGEIATGKQSWVKVQMLGPGTISFWWKADSAYYKKTLLDYATFKVDGKEIGKIGGTSDWQRVTHDVTGDGLHTYLWTYTKTAKTAMGEDCAWLDEVVWTPDTKAGVVVPTTITGGKAVTVDMDWKDVELDEKFGVGTREKFEKRYGADLTAALLKPTGKHDVHGNDRSVWQDNVMGTDPTDKASEFKTVVTMEGGIPVVTWTPDLGVERLYKVWGKASLVGGEWQYPTNSTHRFFKVTVEMPK